MPRGRGGRARGRGGARGGAKSTPPRQHNNRQSHSQSWAQGASTPKLSLVEEARWMSSHRSHAFEPGKQLRNLRIEFVSAGLLEGTIKEKEGEEEGGEEQEDMPSFTDSLANTRAMAEMTIRSPSPTPSVTSTDSGSGSGSSEDEVVFRGRGTTSFTQPTTATTSSLPIRGKPPVASQSGKAPIREIPSEDTPELTMRSSSDRVSLPADESSGGSRLRAEVHARVSAHDADPDSETDSVVQDHFQKRLGGKSVWETNTPEWVHRSKPGIGWEPAGKKSPPVLNERLFMSAEEAAMEDFKQNILQSGSEEEMLAKVARGFARRDMDINADHNDWVSDMSEVQKQEDGWNADTLGDLDGLSTSSDIEDTIERIVRKRTRETGVQYLVVYEGSVADDARWLPATFLKSPNDLDLIKIFEAETHSTRQQMSSSDDDDDDDASDDSEDTDEDEEMPQMDDERIARILQKQEELGLPSDEVLLHGDDEFFDDLEEAAIAYGFDRPNKKRQRRSKGGRRSQPNFPSASVMADVLDMDPYNGFDVMDTERPSLRPRKKGRRGQLPPELEDSEFKDEFRAMWEGDREKKRLKKAEREELRKQGLLGRKGKAPDLSVKYQGGVTMPDIVEEIRDFLISEMQTLSLPPMDAARRATIHQLVNKLGVNSKSRGDGAARFTVLSKTSRTREFDDDFFESLMEKKKFSKRLQPRGTFRQTTKTRVTVSYKDGDTVGASAPELGRENKGHALMEKMGWTKGMALGAVDNKGILQPIPHIVKTTKAGLQ